MEIPDSVRELVEGGPLAHLATINQDGSPQVTVIWIGIDGEHLVSGHMNESVKVRNVRRDPRVVLSFDAPRTPGTFLAEHVVLRASTTIEEGGAWSLLDRLAKVYVGPDVTFPAPESAGGFVLRYTIEHVGGVGPWVRS
jgi:PPOX class probable F420-dependent enzyme